MSQRSGRRAAFGAALLGAVLLLVSGVTGALPQASAQPRVPASSSAPSLVAAPSQLGHAVLRTTHASATGTVGTDRSSGGHGAPPALPVALLLLALASVAVAVRRSRPPLPHVHLGARASRAPPAPAPC